MTPGLTSSVLDQLDDDEWIAISQRRRIHRAAPRNIEPACRCTANIVIIRVGAAKDREYLDDARVCRDGACFGGESDV